MGRGRGGNCENKRIKSRIKMRGSWEIERYTLRKERVETGGVIVI